MGKSVFHRHWQISPKDNENRCGYKLWNPWDEESYVLDILYSVTRMVATCLPRYADLSLRTTTVCLALAWLLHTAMNNANQAVPPEELHPVGQHMKHAAGKGNVSPLHLLLTKDGLHGCGWSTYRYRHEKFNPSIRSVISQLPAAFRKTL